jgi:hypothetical protein
MLFHYGFTQGNNDPNNYQLPPYGHGSGVGVPIGYGQFNPQPASPSYPPAPGGPGAGMPGGSVAPMWEGAPGSRYPQAPGAGAVRAPAPPNNATSGYSPPAGRGSRFGFANSTTASGRSSAQNGSPRRVMTLPQMLRGPEQPKQNRATPAGYSPPQSYRYP